MRSFIRPIATRPALSHTAVLIVATLASLCSSAAVAQWSPHFTSSLGRGYGNIALSQSILSGTRRLGAGAGAGAPARSDAGRPVSLTPAQIDAALTYTADPQQSQRIHAAMIDAMSGPNPAKRAEIEKAFADDIVLKEFERFMSSDGYSSRNVADDMAALLVICWEIFTGGTANKPQIRGAHQQVRGNYLSSPAIRAMRNAERQEVAERIAYQVVIALLSKQEAERSGDPAKLAQARQSAASMLLKLEGVDITQLQLTERGFSKKS